MLYGIIYNPATCYHIFCRDCPVLPWNRNVMCQVPVQEILLPQSLLLFLRVFNCEELNGVLYLLAFLLWNNATFHQIIVKLVVMDTRSIECFLPVVDHLFETKMALH